ncbi:unnamed protein product [Caenorhabditis angaria]|uniref:Peptidase M13 C-terminal domain-containing protein n=1 Tax=Caenorhabditis angaria TaxID=860376 RepID=A0A9P1IDI3_9PELO|nr:unnamed protein product [Caenorhabditis angaria]
MIPCDDFYEFACGNYAKTNPIGKSEQIRSDVLFEMKTELDKFIKKSLENFEPRSEGALIHYEACRKYQKDLGDFRYLIGNFSESSGSWESVSGNLSRLGIHPIIRNLVLVSFGEEDRNELMFADPKDYLNSSQVLLDAHDLLESLEVNETDIQEFQTFLKSSSKLRREIQDFSYINISSFGDFKENFGSIKFDEMFGELSDSTIVNNLNWPFFEALNSKINRFSQKTIKDYLILSLIKEMKKYMEQDCLSQIKQLFPFFILKKIILPKKFEETKTGAENLVKLIKNKMMTRIRKEEWIENNDTRSRAFDKIEAMTENFGFLENEDVQEENVKNLKPDEFFENIFKIKNWMFQGDILRLGKKAKPDLRPKILDVQAFYIPTYNQMFFTAPILTPPLFAPNSPPFITFGALGTAIGHEITHGFDNRGSKFNKHGKSENWWDEETSQKFENRTECIREQYHKATEEFMGRKLEELEVPGNLLGENIADNGGLRLAYRVFEKQMEKDGRKLEGFEDYSLEQMFFIVYANNFCETINPSKIDEYLSNESHSFGKLRVNLPLKNFHEFAQVFNCSKESAMRAENKCRVW